jgi:hypothetical protein
MGCGVEAPVDSNTTDSDTPSTTDTVEDVEGAFDVVLTTDERFLTVVTATWTTEFQGTSWVEYGLDGALDHVTPEHGPGASHAVPVLGMKAGRDYSFRAVSVDEAGQRWESAVQSLSLANKPQELSRLNISQVDAAQL